MLPAIVVAAVLTGAPPQGAQPDPLSPAIENFRTIQTYRVTIRSVHADGEEEHIRYYYKKPGFVRMEFIRPHAGAVMIFSPDTGRVRLWPFGAGRFPELNLAPDNSIIRSLSGIHVDRSDVGTLFENIRLLGAKGTTAVLGEETMNGRKVLHFIVTGGGGSEVDDVHSSEMWLDEATRFPARVTSRDTHGAVIETVRMDDLELNEALPDTLFGPP